VKRECFERLLSTKANLIKKTGYYDQRLLNIESVLKVLKTIEGFNVEDMFNK